jgi:hypothetical protein
MLVSGCSYPPYNVFLFFSTKVVVFRGRLKTPLLTNGRSGCSYCLTKLWAVPVRRIKNRLHYIHVVTKGDFTKAWLYTGPWQQYWIQSSSNDATGYKCLSVRPSLSSPNILFTTQRVKFRQVSEQLKNSSNCIG